MSGMNECSSCAPGKEFHHAQHEYMRNEIKQKYGMMQNKRVNIVRRGMPLLMHHPLAKSVSRAIPKAIKHQASNARNALQVRTTATRRNPRASVAYRESTVAQDKPNAHIAQRDMV